MPTLSSCNPRALTITLGLTNGAAGSLVYVFDVTSHASQSCPVGGYFGVSIYDPQGHVITASASRETATPDQPVELAPGGKATTSVLVGETSANGNSATCPLIGSFHLIPPNATSDVQVSIPASTTARDCGGVSVQPTEAG